LPDNFLVERFMHLVVFPKQVQLTDATFRQPGRIYDRASVVHLMQTAEQRCSSLLASLLHTLVQHPRQAGDYLGASRNSEFAQIPHKGTPIHYGQKQLVWSRQQGADKIPPRHICFICKQGIFSAT
jgi:hypothetical protein